MNGDALETLVGDALRGVNRSSTSSSKFDALAGALAEHWGIPPGAVAVKAIADPKNHGNRISEGTRGSATRLVLLADEPPDLDALARTFSKRALLALPTLVLAEENDRWTIIGILTAPDEPNPFDVDAPIRHVVLPEPDPVDLQVREAVIARIASLAGAPVGVDVEALLTAHGVDERTVIVKHVPEARHLGNRIGEGLGRRPAFLVLVTTPELLAAVHRRLPEHLERSPGTVAHVVCHGPDGLIVQPVASPDAAPAASPSRAPAASADLFADGDAPSDDDGTEEAPPNEDAPEDPDTEEEASYRRLPRVRLLLDHLSLDASSKELYEELKESSAQTAPYETPTLAYLRDLLRAPERTFVVLTGNAGHGKTHLCRRILEGDAAADEVAAGPSGAAADGRERSVSGASLPVRVLEDLSGVSPPERAASLLVELLAQDRTHVIVCANEGRLRDVASRSPDELGLLLDALEEGLKRGGTHPPGRPDVHVVNLNAQSATADDGGFLAHVAGQFLDHEGAWRTCRSCRAADACPILANRRALVRPKGREPGPGSGRAALIELVRVAEEGGYVLTYRETIQLAAFLVTGGIDCGEVEAMHRDARRRDGLAEHRTLDLLFERELSSADLDAVPIVERLRRLDPGKVASRPVDERIHAARERAGGLGSGLFDESTRQLRTRKDLSREQQAHRDLVRRARREAWFASPETDEHGVVRTDRLGLRHHRTFRALRDESDVPGMLATLRTLIRGLHAVQGAIGIDSTSDFHLVDPAFGRSGSHSAIVARSLPTGSLKLVPETAWWRSVRDGRPVPMLDAIEWIDRRVLLIDEREPDDPLLALDLLGFEFVMNAAEGIVMRDFHAAARRRILRTLARRAQRDAGAAPDVIRVLTGGHGEERLIIERDHTVALGGRS